LFTCLYIPFSGCIEFYPSDEGIREYHIVLSLQNFILFYTTFLCSLQFH